MKERVIATAKILWYLLGEKGELSLTQLPKYINEKEEIIFQALGWLAREDKIEYRSNKRANYVSLTSWEADVYKSLPAMNAECEAAIS